MKLVFVEWTGWSQGRTAPNYNKITGHHWFYLRNINVCVDAEGKECTYETADEVIQMARQIAEARRVLET